VDQIGLALDLDGEGERRGSGRELVERPRHERAEPLEQAAVVGAPPLRHAVVDGTAEQEAAYAAGACARLAELEVGLGVRRLGGR
jgi:hypothetical protein